MFIKSTLLALAFSIASVSANAALTPSNYGFDERIQFFEYNPNDVYVINTKIGTSTLIQLDKNEVIEGDNAGLGMGDAEAWSLAVKGSSIFLKPAAELPDTNMMIVTNKRTYAIELTTSGHSPSYLVRFNYPDDAKSTDKEDSLSAKSGDYLKTVGTDAQGQPILVPNNINTSYYKRGDEEIMPTHVWDDGLFTFFKYPNAKDLPVVYKVLSDNSETLVNSHIVDDTLVVHGTNRVYRLRFGKSVGDISTSAYDPNGYYNETGTSDKRIQRVEQ
ncbi:MAG: TrbG/VirB9 family P-type conjugative transfer protein [Proteus vulgaris]|jgi:type IV secretion system protein VirB9